MTQKQFASLGGKERAKNLTKIQRTEIAKLGGKARKGWRKVKITQ